MWYLDIDNILILAGFIVLLAIFDWFASGRVILARQLLLLGLFMGFLWLYSKELAVFYICYIISGFLFCTAIAHLKHPFKKPLFLLGILFNLSVFLSFRFLGIKSVEMSAYLTIMTIGLAYNMLKAIDALYMAYFADVRINLLKYAVYILFIPTFTSGPILRYRDFEKDLTSPLPLDSSSVENSIQRLILGLFKKIVLVELLLLIYNQLLAGELDWKKSTYAVITYYVLLYLDFSGYTDIAIGFGRLMGFRVPENFKRPFRSPTLTQFWRNWHATLGDWFRDHIFILMARKSRSRLISGFSAFAVMVFIGLWHGLQPLFILWGLYHGILLFLENILNLSVFNRNKLHTVNYYLRCLLVNILVAFGTIFFSSDLQTVLKILKGFIK
ncbi:MAG TPA: MBOAT family O-acyltransferase [Clostridia bacterium]|nr:MBOAT family O-acyltransferase [Clostridia bacterium]